MLESTQRPGNCESRYRLTTLAAQLISDDVAKRGSVEWWHLESKCDSYQLQRTVRWEKEIKDSCVVSSQHITQKKHAAKSEHCFDECARDMESRVQRNVCSSSMPVEIGVTFFTGCDCAGS